MPGSGQGWPLNKEIFLCYRVWFPLSEDCPGGSQRNPGHPHLGVSPIGHNGTGFCVSLHSIALSAWVCDLCFPKVLGRAQQQQAVRPPLGRESTTAPGLQTSLASPTPGEDCAFALMVMAFLEEGRPRGTEQATEDSMQQPSAAPWAHPLFGGEKSKRGSKWPTKAAGTPPWHRERGGEKLCSRE